MHPGPQRENDRGDGYEDLAVNHCGVVNQLWILCVIDCVWINTGPQFHPQLKVNVESGWACCKPPHQENSKHQEATIPEGKDIQGKQNMTPR